LSTGNEIGSTVLFRFYFNCAAGTHVSDKCARWSLTQRVVDVPATEERRKSSRNYGALVFTPCQTRLRPAKCNLQNCIPLLTQSLRPSSTT